MRERTRPLQYWEVPADDRIRLVRVKTVRQFKPAMRRRSWEQLGSCCEELPEHEDDLHEPVHEAEAVVRELDLPTVFAFMSWLHEVRDFGQPKPSSTIIIAVGQRTGACSEGGGMAVQTHRFQQVLP